MRYMVMHYQTQEMEDGVLPVAREAGRDRRVHAGGGDVRRAALRRGRRIRARQGARVEVTDGDVRVIDGPFAEAKELIAGFAILEVDSLAEAVEHARKFALLVGAERVDVRRVIEFEDLRPPTRRTRPPQQPMRRPPRLDQRRGDAVARRVAAGHRPAGAARRRPRHRRGARPGHVRRRHREVAARRRAEQPGGLAAQDRAVPRRRPDPPPRHPAQQVPAGRRRARRRPGASTSTRSSTATWPTTCSA